MDLHRRFTQIPYNLDVVNIGSGPSFYDFDWSAVPEVAGYNMAIAPEDFRYDSRIIKNYGMHLKPGAVVVVVVVCPLSFGKNEYLYRDSFSEKYASILPFEDVDLPFWKYVICRDFPWILRARNGLQKILAYIKKRMKNRKGCSVGLVVDDQGMEPLDPWNALLLSWISQNSHLYDLKDAGQASYYQDVFKEKLFDLESVIENCRKFELFPVLLIPPMSAGLRANLSEEFIQAFVYDNLSKLTMQNIPLLDYLKNEKYQADDLYTNGLFLKPEPRRTFTKLVWGDIQKIRKRLGGE